MYPNGPFIWSANIFFSAFTAANLAKVFLAILNFEEEELRAFLKELNSATDVPL